MFIDTTQNEGVYTPSFLRNEDLSTTDFLRSVKVRAYSIIANSIRSKGFCHSITHSLFSGKMTRSNIIFSIGTSCGVALERMITIASSIELLHEASLVHDDIQDNQEYRRGIPTIWKKHSINEAISWGDFLLSLSLEPFIEDGTINDIKHLNSAIQRMLEGQNLEHSSASKQITEPDYLNIIKLKTTTLIEVSVKLLLSKSDKNYENLLQATNSLGLAYQIKNDLNDFLRGDLGIDYKNKISSLPFLELYKIRQAKNKQYNYNNVFNEKISNEEFNVVQQAIAPKIENYTNQFNTIFKNNLSKDCYNILRKSFDIYFKR